MIEKYFTKEEKIRIINFLLTLFAFFFFTLIFLLILLPGIRNANKPKILPESLTTSLKTGWLDPLEFPPLKEGGSISLTPKEVFQPSEEFIQKGESLYGIYCLTCHGEKGEGDGIGATGMSPPPRNFKKLSDFKNDANIQGIYKTLTEGIPNSSMQSYEYLSKYDLMALTIKVLKLGAIEISKDSKTEAFILNLFSQKEPPKIKIPFSFAKKIVIEEYEKMEDIKKVEPFKYFSKEFIGEKENVKFVLSKALINSKNYEDFKKIIFLSLEEDILKKFIYLKDKDLEEIYKKMKGERQ